MGIINSFLNWNNSYFNNRELYVKMNYVESYIFEATNRSPQGPPLGPVLFLLFINKMASIFEDVQVLLFSDDFKLLNKNTQYRRLLILQFNLNKLIHSSMIISLYLNIQTCLLFVSVKYKVV